MSVHNFFQRLGILVGVDAVEALNTTKVLVFGLGGVGGWCAEALVRSGIGAITLVDSDTVSPSNINRQIQASNDTIGLLKTTTLEQRLRGINPECRIQSFPHIFSRETISLFNIAEYDYVIDAIDSLTHKLDLIQASLDHGAILFSSMGMAQKINPQLIRSADIWETSGCPLARLVRQGLRKRGFLGNFKVVYSPEQIPRRDLPDDSDTAPTGAWDAGKKVINGTCVTVTATAGMVLASLVIQDVCKPYG